MSKLTWVKPTISKVAVKSVTRGPSSSPGGDSFFLATVIAS